MLEQILQPLVREISHANSKHAQVQYPVTAVMNTIMGSANKQIRPRNEEECLFGTWKEKAEPS